MIKKVWEIQFPQKQKVCQTFLSDGQEQTGPRNGSVGNVCSTTFVEKGFVELCEIPAKGDSPPFLRAITRFDKLTVLSRIEGRVAPTLELQN